MTKYDLNAGSLVREANTRSQPCPQQTNVNDCILSRLLLTYARYMCCVRWHWLYFS